MQGKWLRELGLTVLHSKAKLCTILAFPSATVLTFDQHIGHIEK